MSEPFDIRQFSKTHRAKGGSMPRALDKRRLELFAPEIAQLTQHVTNGRFGTILWNPVTPPPPTPEQPPQPPQFYVDVVTTTFVAALLPGLVPPEILSTLRARCCTCLNVAQDLVVLLFEDVPVFVAEFVADAVAQAFPAENNGAVDLSQGVSFAAIGATAQDCQQAFGKLAGPFSVFSIAGGNDATTKKSMWWNIESNSNNSDPKAAFTASLKQLEISSFQFIPPPKQLGGAGNPTTLVTLAGLGVAWWDVINVLVAATTPPPFVPSSPSSSSPASSPGVRSPAGGFRPPSISIKLSNECTGLFTPPRSGRLVVPYVAASPATNLPHVAPANSFFVSSDICNLLRSNITLDIDTLELPPQANETSQYALVRVRNAGHVARLQAAGKFFYSHDVWRSQMPGRVPRSTCGASAANRRFMDKPANVPGDASTRPLVIAVDSLVTRMKDDCFSLEVRATGSGQQIIELTAYIACPLTDDDVLHGRSKFLAGPVISQALERLTTKNTGDGKKSMLDNDNAYSLSRAHCGGQPRAVLAVTAVFDATTLLLKSFREPVRQRIVIHEELETGFVRALEEQDAFVATQQGAAAADSTAAENDGVAPSLKTCWQNPCNVEVGTRLKLLNALYERNKGLGYGSRNDRILFPDPAPQRVAESSFMRETYGRDRADCIFRAVLAGGNGWSDWSRHCHGLCKFLFGAGARAAVLANWDFDLEVGEAAASRDAKALEPLVRFLRAHYEEGGGTALVAQTAVPVWEAFMAASKQQQQSLDAAPAAAAAVVINDDDDDDEKTDQQYSSAAATAVALPKTASLNAVTLTLLVQSLPQVQSVSHGISEFTAVAAGATSSTKSAEPSSPPSSPSSPKKTLRLLDRDSSALRHLITANTSDSCSSVDEFVAARRRGHVFIADFDVTDDRDFESLLSGTKPLRKGTHTLGHYLALRTPNRNAKAADKERAQLRALFASEKMTEKLLDAEEQSRRDSVSGNLLLLLDRNVPVKLKRVLMCGYVCGAPRTKPEWWSGDLCCVFVPVLGGLFVAANVERTRGVTAQLAQAKSKSGGGGGAAAAEQQFSLPPMSRVQLVMQGEDGSRVGGVSRDQVTNSFEALDFSAQHADARKDPAAAALWKLAPMRGSDGGVWYASGSGEGSSFVSFRLFVDSRSAWQRTFSALLGGPPVAGRATDTASLRNL